MRWLNRASVITQRPSGGISPRCFASALNTESIPWQLPLTPLIPEVATFTEATSNFSDSVAALAWALTGDAAKSAATTSLPRLTESVRRTGFAAHSIRVPHRFVKRQFPERSCPRSILR
jgi:hypothetical protein